MSPSTPEGVAAGARLISLLTNTADVLEFDGGTVLVGDCLHRLRQLPDNSVDSVVTDPPYGLTDLPGDRVGDVVGRWLAGERGAAPSGKGFMGKSWDAFVPPPAVWDECMRVLKPGGHLLAFAGTRTVDLMTLSIRLAGFEIRDSLHWVYGSGFPKSLDVSKAIDKQRHDRADIYKVTAWVRERRDAAGIGNKDIDDAFGFAGMAGHWTSGKSQPAVPTLEQVSTLLAVLGVELDDVPADIKQLLWDLNGKKGQPGENWAKREVVGTGTSGTTAIWSADGGMGEFNITAPATDAAKQWAGFGTALKPAHEPVVVARKPLVGTVAANVLEHGTGGLNIDGCRVGSGPVVTRLTNNGSPFTATASGETAVNAGRWPANLLFTHAAECDGACAEGCPVAELDGQSGVGVSKAGGRSTRATASTWDRNDKGMFDAGRDVPRTGHNDTGGASRFFTVTEWDPIADVAPFRYVAKPSKKERNAGLDGLPEVTYGLNRPPQSDVNEVPLTNKNAHPTVKPVALMRWLVRLVTPPGGTVLDPFLGSGTTAVAATLEGFQWVGCEMTADYLPIIAGRVAWAEGEVADQAQQLPLDDAA